MALGLIGVVVGEMFGGSEGIGYMVNYGGQTFQTDAVFLGVVIIAFAGIVLTWLAERLERHFSRWRGTMMSDDPRLALAIDHAANRTRKPGRLAAKPERG